MRRIWIPAGVIAAGALAAVLLTGAKEGDPARAAGRPAARERVSAPPAEDAPAAGRSGAAQPAVSEDGLHPSELLARESMEIPRAPMGRSSGSTSMLADQFAAHPELLPDDPEADSVERGRRLVGPVDMELDGGFDTPEALAEAFLDAVFYESQDMFHEIRVREGEFRTIFWPEFPQSRPITNVSAADAWQFHNVHCLDGVQEVLDRFGGQRLHLQEVRVTTGIAPYRNFNLYKGVVIEAADDDGNLVSIGLAPVFAERNGLWKIYMYDA